MALERTEKREQARHSLPDDLKPVFQALYEEFGRWPQRALMPPDGSNEEQKK